MVCQTGPGQEPGAMPQMWQSAKSGELPAVPWWKALGLPYPWMQRCEECTVSYHYIKHGA